MLPSASAATGRELRVTASLQAVCMLAYLPTCLLAYACSAFAESPDDFAQAQNMVAAFNLMAGARHVGEDFSLDRIG